MKRPKAIIIFFLFLLYSPTYGQETTRYMEPPKEILEIVNAPATPRLSLSPTRSHAIFAYPQEMPDISELALDELRLAGLRINPNNYGSSRINFIERITIRKISNEGGYPITGLPADGRIASFQWSPNGTSIALAIYRTSTIELWVVDANTGKATQWATNLHSALVSNSFVWLPNSSGVLFASRVLYREPFVDQQKVPTGPSIQESQGKASRVRTFQDLLQNKADEEKFEHYAYSQIMLANGEQQPKPIGNPDLITDFTVSPNGEYILVEQLMRPFSYIVPYNRFPKSVQIWTINGNLFKQIAETPLAEDIPQGFSAVQKGPRNFSWRADAPASIYWVEAQDDGDPKRKVEVRDIVYILEAPFKSKPQPLISMKLRFAGIQWGWETVAIAYERWWDTRRLVASIFNPSSPSQPMQTVWDRSWQDAYGDPGSPILEANLNGFLVLRSDKTKRKLYLTGQGASPKGNMPFIDEMDLATFKTKRLWQCQAPFYEQFIAFLNKESNQFLTIRESVTEQPNYQIRDIKRNSIKQFTNFAHPYPQLANVNKELVRYKRADGVELTGNLYLPSGYVKGSEQLPVLMWAYPQEYVDPDLAAQVKESPYRFIRPGRTSPILWVTRGYAVLDNPGMPIIGKDSLLPNDSFIEQLVSNAKAAIDALTSMGVADPKRIAIGGHSYGAFMAANLLAHSDLFATAIARSGAYNRTLTPFGFQGEERNLWEAPEVYLKMSPFMFANKINEPILLIHGESDNNSGTFPMQSERFFSALKGFGANARLVILLHESHGYRAKQSILHTLWEMDTWLEKHIGEK